MLRRKLNLIFEVDLKVSLLLLKSPPYIVAYIYLLANFTMKTISHNVHTNQLIANDDDNS